MTMTGWWYAMAYKQGAGMFPGGVAIGCPVIGESIPESTATTSYGLEHIADPYLAFGQSIAEEWQRAQCRGKDGVWQTGTPYTPGGLAALIATRLRAEFRNAQAFLARSAEEFGSK